MLYGRFGDTSGRPYIEGRIDLPRLGMYTDVSFLVDTGADRTVLMPINGLAMGLDYSRLDNPSPMSGIDGKPTGMFQEPALATFAEGRRYLRVYQIVVLIAPPTKHNRDVTTVLGRDILDRWRMTYDATNPRLAFKVLSADHTITVPR